MDKLLEIGEIGLIRDIPAEIGLLANENNVLKARCASQKSELRFLYIVIAGILIYILIKHNMSGLNNKKEDEHFNT